MSTETPAPVAEPIARVRLLQPRNPVFWVAVWLMVNGAYVYAVTLAQYDIPPSAMILGLEATVVYLVPWLWFLRHKDRFDVEPARLAAFGFLFGGLVSTWLMSAPANGTVLDIWAKVVDVDFAVTWGPALTAPFTEEFSKFLGVLVLVFLARDAFRTVYDGILLGAFVGLGFQVFENSQYVLSTIDQNYAATALHDAVFVAAGRAATGVFSHALFTALTGAAAAYVLTAKDRSTGHRIAVGVGLYALAMLVHGSLDAVAAIGPSAILLNVAFSIVGIVVMWRIADRQTNDWVMSVLATDLADGTLTPEEVEVLAGTPRRRRQYLRSVRRAEGSRARTKARWALTAGADLVTAVARTGSPDAPEAQEARREVARVRSL